MKKDFVLTCFSLIYLGVGLTVNQLGREAGIDLWLRLIIFISSLVLFMFVAFTSIQKITDKLYNKDEDLTLKSSDKTTKDEQRTKRPGFVRQPTK